MLLDRLYALKSAIDDRLSRAVEIGSKNLRDPNRIVVFDSSFPNLASPFRIAEVNSILNAFPNAFAVSTVQAFSFEKRRYLRRYHNKAARISKFSSSLTYRAKLAYVIFLQNAFDFLPALERANTPFVFELYPGGSFAIDNPSSDKMLRRVCSSPMFRGVIATQAITRRYLTERGFCAPEKILFVYGGVLPLIEYSLRPGARKKYPSEKSTLDICFVANRYMPRGEDKGYDVFVDVAQRLARSAPAIRFHVIGDYNATTIPLGRINGRFTFYGTKDSSFFPSFYQSMDIVLSPNRSSTLLPGAFDGFPTGSCIEAGSCGVAMFVSDPLGLNVPFTNGQDIIIVKPDGASIETTIRSYIKQPGRLYKLAQRGATRTFETFNERAQMTPRINYIRHLSDDTSV